MEIFQTNSTKIIITCWGIAILSIIFYYKRAFTYWKIRNIPYIEPTIPLGNVPNPIIKRENVGVQVQGGYNLLKSLAYTHAGVYILTEPKFFAVDPEIIKAILQKDFDHFTDRGFYYNDKDDPLSANLFALGGERWQYIRKKLSPAFTAGKLKVMFDTLVQSGYQLRRAIDEIYTTKREIDIKDLSISYSIDVIGSCAFGLDCNSFVNPNSKFRAEGKKIFDFSSIFRIIKVGFAFHCPTIAKLLGVQLFDKESTKFFTNIVKEIVKFRQENNVVRNDMIQLLTELKKNALRNELKNGEADAIEDEGAIKELAAQVFIFFAAGFETSSTTLTYCLYELAVNPAVQENLRKEVKTVLAKHDNEITYDSIMDMKYMDQIIEETLRKYPPVSFITRVCVKDYSIPNSDTVLEKGIEVIVSILGLHHDSEYYPEPDKFDPERFNEKNKQRRRPFTYLPFGEGPRICIGLRFALTQIKVALTALLQHHKFSLNNKTVQPTEFETFSFTLIPKTEIYLNIEKIDN